MPTEHENLHVQVVTEHIAEALKKLEDVVGPNYKLTFVGRCVNEYIEDGDIITTNDDLWRVADAVIDRASAGESCGIRRMWVKIRDTDIGIPIDVDPTQTKKHNKRVAMEGAKKLLAPYNNPLQGLIAFGGKLLGHEYIAGELPEEVPSVEELELEYSKLKETK